VTYFSILATFVIPPTLALMALVPQDIWRWLPRREGKVSWKPYSILLVHVLIALFYTTPWDNYLVATRVWWYDPELVSGFTLGWVPIEEYAFFIVQTLLTGLWTLALMRLIPKSSPGVRPNRTMHLWATVVVAGAWLISITLLLMGWGPGTYLALILSWALIPVLIQVSFGVDILITNWRLLIASILPPTLYLWLVDALAIRSGTWTIDPAQTVGLKVGVLPLEEMIFFLMTNLIICFGVTLMLSEVSKRRVRTMLARLKEYRKPVKDRRVLTQTPEGHVEASIYEQPAFNKWRA
jgi:lycopene cyclase domain-containing protein